MDAQVQTFHDFKWPVYFERNQMEKGQTNFLKTLVTGQSAETLPNGWLLVIEPRIVHFLPSGQTNAVAVSSSCFLDPKLRTVFSTNVLSVVAGTNQMKVEGVGYFGHLTNLFLIFSNDVRTVIRQELAESTRTNTGLLGVSRAIARTNSEIHITAERLHLDYERNLATYFHSVHVENPTTVLDSEKLTIKRSPAGDLENILAETNVVIRQKLEPGYASGDRALYYMRDGQEALMLTGTPARWQQREREGEAGWITYYMNDRILRAEEKANVRFPLTGATQSDWLLPGRRRTNAPPSPIAQFMEVHAETITSWLASSNRPGHRVVAQTNVVIVGMMDQTLATATTAEYQEHLGTLELLGEAYWQQGQRIVRGDRLFYDRTNQIFLSEGSAYLQVPVNEMGQPGATNRPQQFIQTHSDRFDYRNGYLTFYDDVRSALVESNAVRGRLTGGLVRLKLSNQVERVTARRNVEAEEFRPSPAGLDTKKLNCEFLTIELNTNGSLRRVYADTNVVAQQNRRAGNKATRSSLSAQSVFAEFFAHTNDVRELLAGRNVIITSDDSTATGQRATYTATNNLVELTGRPTLETPKIRLDQAEAILFDRATQKFSARNPSGQARAPTNAPNQKLFPDGK